MVSSLDYKYIEKEKMKISNNQQAIGNLAAGG